MCSFEMWDCEQFLNVDDDTDFLDVNKDEYHHSQDSNHSEEENINGQGTIKGTLTLFKKYNNMGNLPHLISNYCDIN